MSRDDIAIALEKAAEALAEAAFAIRASDPSAARADVAPSAPAAAGVSGSSAPAASSVIDQGECPKHHKAWTMGTYGPYCTAQTDDPAWAKVKPDGKMFCKITPKNAPDWLRVHGVAA